MIRISDLFWTLLTSLTTTLLSYFYVNKTHSSGYPLTYFKLEEAPAALSNQLIGQWVGKINYFSFVLDLLFWWLIFSTLLVLVKNYLFD